MTTDITTVEIDGFIGSITDFNSLIVLGIELVFMFVLITLAYWRKDMLLYILAGCVCMALAFIWLQDRDIQYMLIIGLVSLSLGIITLLKPVINYFTSD